ncbi:cytochrome P450 [Fennellomyces sp. T-0311]|nr:cytochrome P450 [Fennellomyces sp. T-0311]
MTVLDTFSFISIAPTSAVVAVILVLVHYLFPSKPRHLQNTLDLIPTPKGCYPYFGHFLSFDKLPGSKLKEWHDELGPVIRIQMGVQQWITISDPNIVHHVLTVNGAVASNRPYQRFTSQGYSNGGRGIVFQGANARWKHLRAVTSSMSMSPTVINKEIYAIQADAMKLVDGLVSASQEHGAVDPLLLLKRADISHTFRTCIGIDVDAISETLLQRVFDFTHEGLVLAGAHNDYGGFFPILSFLDKLPGRNSRQEKFLREKDPLLRELLYIALNAENNNMFKHLYYEQKQLGLEEADLLVALADLLLGAADNVTAVMKWMIAILLHYPDLHKRLREEVDEFIREHDGRLPLFSEKDSFPLFLSVLKESMRYRGTNYTTLPHVLTKDIHYKNYIFPKGVLILPASYAMHRNSAQYPDPEKFVPERFVSNPKSLAADMTGKIEERSLYMFGWGRRACPGIYLAEAQLFTFITCLLTRCDILPPTDGTMPNLDDIRDGGVVVSPPPFEARFAHRANNIF